MSTGIGDGIAIPHAAAAIEAPAIVIGISPAGIDFDAVDGAPVHIFFLLIGSRQAPGPQLKALARIARLTRRNEFVAGLRAARSVEEVLALLTREDEEAAELPSPRGDTT
jgi:mannitol/fructose-specific phosphotransferase system IIA component (Ntr-type)